VEREGRSRGNLDGERTVSDGERTVSHACDDYARAGMARCAPAHLV